MSQATDSQFAMLRGVIALAWVDGKPSDGEKAQLENYISKNINISDSQKVALNKEIVEHISIEDVWGDITNTMDRAHLIDIAKTVFWKDGNYSVKEKAVYDKIYKMQLATIDEDAFQKDEATFQKDIES